MCWADIILDKLLLLFLHLSELVPGWPSRSLLHSIDTAFWILFHLALPVFHCIIQVVLLFFNFVFFIVVFFIIFITFFHLFFFLLLLCLIIYFSLLIFFIHLMVVVFFCFISLLRFHRCIFILNFFTALIFIFSWLLSYHIVIASFFLKDNWILLIVVLQSWVVKLNYLSFQFLLICMIWYDWDWWLFFISSLWDSR